LARVGWRMSDGADFIQQAMAVQQGCGAMAHHQAMLL